MVRFASFFTRLRKARKSPGRRTNPLGFECLESRDLPAGHPLCFSAASTLAVGNSPNSVATADFNRDSRLDLAVANINSNTVSLLLGNGDGSFQPATSRSVGREPRGVFVGDFNNDGKLDLATANQSLAAPAQSGISILLGNGDGTFPTKKDTVTGKTPQWLALGHLNGDGNLDIVSGNGANNISVLLGKGDGTFQPHQQLTAGSSPFAVNLGDFNEDGKLDMVSSNTGGMVTGNDTVTVLLGAGDGVNFTSNGTFAVGDGPGIGQVVDFNGDAHLDLAVQNFLSGDTSVLLGNGDGTFQPVVNYNAGPNSSSVVAADLNGDGWLDLTVTTFDYFNNPTVPGTVRVLLGNGNGTFQPAVPAATVGELPGNPALGDFDADGQLDMAVPNNGDNNVSVLLNRSAATQVTLAGPATIAAGETFTVTVAARNACGDVDAGYRGTIHFSSSDPQADLPPDVPLVNGTATFSVTLKTANAQTFYVTDTENGALTDSIDVQVAPVAADHFRVSGPASTTVGSSWTFAVEALDPYGNTDTNFSGAVHFSSDDGQAALPPDSSLSAGFGTFNAMLKTAGTRALTATDGAITGTAAVTVEPTAADHFAVAAPASASAGLAFTFTVTAQDPYGNTDPGFTGMIQFGSDDNQAVLPQDGALSNGVGTFSVTLNTLGVHSLSASQGTLSSATTVDVLLKIFAVGIDGKVPVNQHQVQVYNVDGSLRFPGFDPYKRRKTKGVRVAVGDLNGDKIPDVATGPGPGASARLFLYDGLSGATLSSFSAYGKTFSKGIFVAVGNVLDDATSPGNEIVVVANGKKVRVFNALGQRQAQFSPFGTGYRGAVHVAVGNMDGSGLDEIVVTRGGPVEVRIYNGTGVRVAPKLQPSGVAGNPFIAAGDLNGDNTAEIILGDGKGAKVHVFSSSGDELLAIPGPYGESFAGGVRIGLIDRDSDGVAELLTGPGKNAAPDALILDNLTGAAMFTFPVFPVDFRSGFFVAGSL